jgi:HNH endonuclease
MTIRWDAEKYPPLWRCMYCGDENRENLTDEHIIPFGLLPKGGDWFLPKSSCLACAEFTKKFEDRCLQFMLGPLR